MSDTTLTRFHVTHPAEVDAPSQASSKLRTWWEELVARGIDRVVSLVPNPLVVAQVPQDPVERGRHRGEPSRVVLDLLEREARALRRLA